jgi:glycosyltransferase involved in cell wall biosynthesis
MLEPTVSVVIAAYGRLNALRLALRSVAAQSLPASEVIVVCDCCPDEYIAELVGDCALNVRVVNLPVRCGNQYGPNSVGIRLAQGAYVALLNHDDVWLADHLEQAVGRLAEGHDFFIGKAAFCHAVDQARWAGSLGRLVFSEYNQPSAVWRCLTGPFFLFEPASSWVVERQFARRVGDWASPEESYGMPIIDWVRRSVAEGASFVFGEQLTVLKLNLHDPRAKLKYLGMMPFEKYATAALGVLPALLRSMC